MSSPISIISGKLDFSATVKLGKELGHFSLLTHDVVDFAPIEHDLGIAHDTVAMCHEFEQFLTSDEMLDAILIVVACANNELDRYKLWLHVIDEIIEDAGPIHVAI